VTGTPGSPVLSLALRRQQAALTALLRGAGVPPDEAEGLLLGVLTAKPVEWWEQKPQEGVDRELQLRVKRACRRYAERKQDAAPASPVSRPNQGKTRRRRG
jgi:hypothetical protein